MTELNKEEINLINNMAESYWQENNRNHIDNKEEWDLTLNLIKKLAIPNVSNMLTVKEVLDILDDSDHLDDAKTLIRETVS